MGPRRLRRFGVGTALVVVAASVAGFLSRGAAATSAAIAPPVSCDLTQYKPLTGLTAAAERDGLAVTWEGQNGSELRARYAIDSGQPVIRELAVRKAAGAWSTLGQNLTPEYCVVSGVRRMTTQQGQPLEGLGVKITPEVIEKNKWYAFWDAPLVMPAPPPAAGVEGRGRAAGPSGGVGRVYGAPRDPKEIRRASATFSAGSCAVKTDGARLEVTFPGLAMGIFTGNLRFTSYRGTNLFRMEAIAKTDEPSVAYKYEAGLKGLSTSLLPRVSWRDTGGDAQQYEFGGVANETSRHRSREESRARRGRQGRVTGHLHSAPHVFLHPGGRHEPRVRLVSQGRRDRVRHSAFVRLMEKTSRSTSTTSPSTTRLLERCNGWPSISTPVRRPPSRRAGRS